MNHTTTIIQPPLGPSAVRPGEEHTRVRSRRLLGVATAVHWLRYPKIARGHHRDPAMAPFYGAPPMAVLTVGTGALLSAET